MRHQYSPENSNPTAFKLLPKVYHLMLLSPLSRLYEFFAGLTYQEYCPPIIFQQTMTFTSKEILGVVVDIFFICRFHLL
jgi:hypothetical protein